MDFSVRDGALLTSAVVSAYGYTVNNIGQRTNVSTSGSAFAGAAGWTWGYDALGQLSSATHATFNQGYAYDDIGNRKTASASAGGASVNQWSYQANSLNQYTTINSGNPQSAIRNPQFDLDGNQLSGATGPALGQTFVWDGENRLIAVKDASGNVLVTHVYDSGSRRIRRSTASATTLYVYDGRNCVAEYQSGAGSLPANPVFNLSRTLTWGLDLSGSLQGAGGVGGLLSVSSISGSQLSTINYPLYDGNGNISEYLDSTGNTSAHFEYDAFGNTLVSQISNAGISDLFNYRFSTKLQDAVTSWYYYGFRWYDAVSGRWPSRDPIGERGGGNLYGMVEIMRLIGLMC